MRGKSSTIESFLAEKLLERSQGLMHAIDTLENENTQLRDELQRSRPSLQAIESYMADMRQTDEAPAFTALAASGCLLGRKRK